MKDYFANKKRRDSGEIRIKKGRWRRGDEDGKMEKRRWKIEDKENKTRIEKGKWR